MKSTIGIVDARVEFDLSSNHSCQEEQALCSAVIIIVPALGGSLL